MRSSLRVIDAKSGELLGKVSRTGEEEISRLSFSHNDVVVLSNDPPQGSESYRVEAWVGEEGGWTKVVVLDFLDVVGQTDKESTYYDITSYGSFVDGAPVFSVYAGVSGSLTFIEGKIQVNEVTTYAVFPGEESGLLMLKYFFEGYKGFLSVPVVGDEVVVYQETGDREVTVRYFTEGDDV
jgi:hypothetical protein